jgi:hypothetical protein
LRLGDERAHAIDMVAVLFHHAVEVGVLGPARAIRAQGVIFVEQAFGDSRGRQAHAPLQLPAGGLVQSRQIGEAPLHIGRALAHIVGEEGHFLLRQSLLEGEERRHRRQQRDAQGVHADPDQEIAGERGFRHGRQ